MSDIIPFERWEELGILKIENGVIYRKTKLVRGGWFKWARDTEANRRNVSKGLTRQITRKFKNERSHTI